MKRPAASDVKSKKKLKKADSDSELSIIGSDGDDDIAPGRPVAKVRKRASQIDSPTPERDGKDESGVDVALKEDSNHAKAAAHDSDSEMSVLIDEEPKRKSKSRKSDSTKSTSKSTTKSTSKKAGTSKASKGTENPADPDAEEIKRLQGWLVKCGCRKMWYKELAPYDTPKLKIRHLKEMLSDIGMSGRYSIEKATQIREERELKADLEAVQEGEKQWGKDESEEENTSKPRRRLARGLKELDFLNDDDGAETD